MSTTYKTKDKKRMKDEIDENKSFLPMMLFFGVVDMIMFSMMFSMIDSHMGDYMPVEDIPADMQNEGMDDSAFDFDIGF